MPASWVVKLRVATVAPNYQVTKILDIYNNFFLKLYIITFFLLLLHSMSGERSEPQVLCKSITSQAKI